MLNSQLLLQGSWSEVLSRKDDIPGSQRVKVHLDPLQDEEQARLQKGFEDLFEVIDQMEFTPPEGPLPAATQAIVDRFRRKGLIP